MTKIINTNLPSGQQLREYLVKHGWTLAQHDAYLDSALAPAPWDSVRFLVPTRDDFEDYQYRLAQTLRNLSIIEQRPVMVILNEMGHLGNIYDKIRFTIMAIGFMACDLGGAANEFALEAIRWVNIAQEREEDPLGLAFLFTNLEM